MSTTKAPAHRASTKADAEAVEIEHVVLADEHASLVADWKEWRMIRIEAEKAEKLAKAAMLDKIGTKPRKGLSVIVEVAGAVAVKIGWVTKGGIDADVLKDGFPEAYEAAFSDEHIQYPLVNPA